MFLIIIALALLGLVDFLDLREIIMDNNYLSDKTEFPTKRFFGVLLLSLNNNKVSWILKWKFDSNLDFFLVFRLGEIDQKHILDISKFEIPQFAGQSMLPFLHFKNSPV